MIESSVSLSLGKSVRKPTQGDHLNWREDTPTFRAKTRRKGRRAENQAFRTALRGGWDEYGLIDA